MELQELLDEIDAARPGVIGRKVPEKVAAALVRAAFEVVRKQLERTPEGPLKIKGLGVFHVRQVEKGEGAERVKRRVVQFRYKAPEKPQKARKPAAR
jgi:hypothetical protein